MSTKASMMATRCSGRIFSAGAGLDFLLGVEDDSSSRSEDVAVLRLAFFGVGCVLVSYMITRQLMRTVDVVLLE